MRPTPIALYTVSVWLVLAGLAVIYPVFFEIWRAVGIVLLVIAGIDLFSVRQTAHVSGERRLPTTLPLGVWSEVAIRLRSSDASEHRVEVFDHYPTQHRVVNLPQRETIKRDGWTELTYHFLPSQRGEFVFPQIELLVESPLRLWKRRTRLAVASTTRVYPNFAAVAKYALLATDNRLSQLGVRKRRRRGPS